MSASFVPATPAAPSDLAVDSVTKQGRFRFAHLSFTDNATNDFVTCALFTLPGGTGCTEIVDPAITGRRTMTVKLPRGQYTAAARATSWDSTTGLYSHSAYSNTVSVDAR